MLSGGTTYRPWFLIFAKSASNARALVASSTSILKSLLCWEFVCLHSIYMYVILNFILDSTTYSAHHVRCPDVGPGLKSAFVVVVNSLVLVLTRLSSAGF